MDKLILIDGNSLLNRAFYAIRLFTTKDGQPTNGVFGFMKLLFKIIEDESPTHLAVAFDLHAKTFRHHLFEAYKGTRKGMPEELAVQVPVLKDLLRAMGVCTVEKETFEADDLIGTLSKKFGGVEVLIYTGDRDSFQLVDEHVSVCFTKRGVSELDRLTRDNFFEKTGLEPFQIIEEKALMGDASDNIPGVKGIGPKLALDLLHEYRTAEAVFAHFDSLSPSLQKKLSGQEDISRLSKTLATIDTDVPLDLALSDMTLSLPFPAAAREKFALLEFRSLLDSPYFASSAQTVFPETPQEHVEIISVSNLSDVFSALQGEEEFSFCFEADGAHLCLQDREYVFPAKRDLLGAGFFQEDLKGLLIELFTGTRRAVVSDYKALLHVLKGLGISPCCPVEDVSLLSYLLDSNRRAPTSEDFVKDFSLPNEARAYALKKAFSRAAEEAKGSAEETLYRDLELPLETVLFEMEEDGVRIDEKRLPEFSARYQAEIDALTQKIYALAGMEFNINSPVKLSEVLFGTMGLPHTGAKKNSRGSYSTDAEVLERLSEQHEIARLLLRYREIKKLQSTYIDGFKPLIKNGFVHTTYNQTATTTGRLSSANPNLQNIPVRTEEGKELRRLFVAREGNVLIDADYSQIELRLLAHMSGCKPLQEAFLAERDIHAETAARVFGVGAGEVTPLMRRRAKAVNFGIIYGISAYGLSKDVGCTPKEAQNFIEKYFETYPEVKAYMDENVARAKRDGYVTTILGRKRYIPEIKASNFATRSFGERAAMNMPLQGSSADIIKIAMLAVFRRLKKEGLRAKLVLQVHDELVLDAPLDERDAACALLKEEMERVRSQLAPLAKSSEELKVPLTAEDALKAETNDSAGLTVPFAYKSELGAETNDSLGLAVPLTAEVACGNSWFDAK